MNKSLLPCILYLYLCFMFMYEASHSEEEEDDDENEENALERNVEENLEASYEPNTNDEEPHFQELQALDPRDIMPPETNGNHFSITFHT